MSAKKDVEEENMEEQVNHSIQISEQSNPFLDNSGGLRDENSDDDRLCVVCLEYRKTIVCLPCKHFCLCRNCSVLDIHECPMCRADIKDTMEIYN